MRVKVSDEEMETGCFVAAPLRFETPRFAVNQSSEGLCSNRARTSDVRAPSRVFKGFDPLGIGRNAVRISTGSGVRRNVASEVEISTSNDLREYVIDKRVMPRDTDYSSALWHGHYVAWLEEARVLALEHFGVAYSKLVAEYGIELVVYELNINYRRAAFMGDTVSIGVRIEPRGARIFVHGQLRSKHDPDVIHATSTVTHVPIDKHTKKPQRRLPAALVEALYMQTSQKNRSVNRLNVHV